MRTSRLYTRVSDFVLTTSMSTVPVSGLCKLSNIPIRVRTVLLFNSSCLEDGKQSNENREKGIQE
jgi:hypothetical protein